MKDARETVEKIAAARIKHKWADLEQTVKDERETVEKIAAARIKHKWADLKQLDPERYWRTKALAPQRMAEMFAGEEACLLEILSDPALSKEEHEEWLEICRKWSWQHIDLALKIIEEVGLN